MCIHVSFVHMNACVRWSCQNSCREEISYIILPAKLFSQKTFQRRLSVLPFKCQPENNKIKQSFRWTVNPLHKWKYDKLVHNLSASSIVPFQASEATVVVSHLIHFRFVCSGKNMSWFDHIPHFKFLCERKTVNLLWDGGFVQSVLSKNRDSVGK